MTNQMITCHSLKHYSIILIGFFILLLYNCPTAYSQSQSQLEDAILGTWVSDPDQGGNTKWVFTNDGKTKIYYKGTLNESYTYELSRDTVQCGIDMSKRLHQFPDTSFLTLTNVQTGKKKCYAVYGFDEKRLTVRLFGSSNLLHFIRQQ